MSSQSTDQSGAGFCLSELLAERHFTHGAKARFNRLVLDSRQVKAGDAFVLLKSATGNAARSLEFARSASGKAALILSELPIAQEQLTQMSCPVLVAPDLRDWLGSLQFALLQAQASVSIPPIVAVTGTNGKTSIATLIAQAMSELGVACGVLGTAGNGLWPELRAASHTTADVLSAHEQVHKLALSGAKLICLEASSHGLDQQRLQGLPITTAVFTNLTHDHLDYHGTLEHYGQAKARLFAWPTLKHAVINCDDAAAKLMLDQVPSHAQITTYGFESGADMRLTRCALSPAGATAQVELDGERMSLSTSLYGRFNLANIMAVSAALLSVFDQLNDSNLNEATGRDLAGRLSLIAELLPKLSGAKGRMQRVGVPNSCQQSTEAVFLVDYAHTPDALEQSLSALKEHMHADLQADLRLICVFGCGGDRDKTKRAPMTQAALRHADTLIVTADNPRSESVEQIIEDMLASTTEEQRARIHIETDRRAAITFAVQLAGPKDVVLIAGKGHETYQEIAGVRTDFDDSQVLSAALQSALTNQSAPS